MLEDGAGQGGGLATRDDAGSSPPVGALFEALASRYRRAILLYLRDRPGGRADLAALAEHLVGSVEEATDEEAVVTTLVDHHLPKLVEADLVAFDRSEGTVGYRGDPRLEPHLELLV